MSKLIVYQGTKDYFEKEPLFDKRLVALKEKLREFFNLKNVNFLFGSGTSNGAIPTMRELYEKLEFSDKEKELKKEFRCIKRKAGENLEKCLSVMYAARVYYEGIKSKNTEDQKIIDYNKALYSKLIDKVEKHIFTEININFDGEDEQKVLEYYKTFYQKLALRSKDNSRIRVFTTNNDLYNETALDALNLHYINGFGGGLRKFFNPALFNYTWSKRMDTSIDKYEPAEDMVYLYKIHGSVNWRETEKLENNYFEIEEVSPSLCSEKDAVLIYPTPTKQDKSLGSPYVDLFREFQHKLLEPHSVLFVIGYSFSDRHVNEIIYRALSTNSTLNVVIFGRKPEEKEHKEKPIFFIDDNRIFTISGKVEEKDLDGEIINTRNVHHFDYIVNELLPNLDAFRKEDDLVRNFVKEFKKQTTDKDEDREDHIC
jgi:hypothetical protein